MNLPKNKKNVIALPCFNLKTWNLFKSNNQMSSTNNTNPWANFPSWEAEYAASQAKKLAEIQAKKIQLLSSTLFAKFQVDFTKLKSLEELTGLSTDDECEHYIDLETRNVYSWNFEENEWEDLNANADIFN